MAQIEWTEYQDDERIEEGTNATIEIYGEYMDPFLREKNHFGALHSNKGQSCQAPIRPVLTLAKKFYGIGAATIGGSFVIGDWYTAGGGNLKGVGFSAVENGFIVEDYVSSIAMGVVTATIGSTFIVGQYNTKPIVNPRDKNLYRTHKSNVLLGNIITGRKSKRYFQYQTYSL